MRRAIRPGRRCSTASRGPATRGPSSVPWATSRRTPAGCGRSWRRAASP
jgi:hypothetical protein